MQFLVVLVVACLLVVSQGFLVSNVRTQKGTS